jgi:hypothetical protein
MCFSEPYAAKKDHIVFVFDKFQPEEVLDLLLIDFFRPVPFELFQRFDLGETGKGYPALDSAILALMYLCLDKLIEIVDIWVQFF